jgi:hypothetical protein
MKPAQKRKDKKEAEDLRMEQTRLRERLVGRDKDSLISTVTQKRIDAISLRLTILNIK